jgi:hypothetical protein
MLPCVSYMDNECAGQTPQNGAGNGPHDLRMTRMNHLNNEMIFVGPCIKIVSGLRGIQRRLIPRQAHKNTLVVRRRDRGDPEAAQRGSRAGVETPLWCCGSRLSIKEEEWPTPAGGSRAGCTVGGRWPWLGSAAVRADNRVAQ